MFTHFRGGGERGQPKGGQFGGQKVTSLAKTQEVECDNMAIQLGIPNHLHLEVKIAAEWDKNGF